jgi:hypothetical protein
MKSIKKRWYGGGSRSGIGGWSMSGDWSESNGVVRSMSGLNCWGGSASGRFPKVWSE